MSCITCNLVGENPCKYCHGLTYHKELKVVDFTKELKAATQDLVAAGVIENTSTAPLPRISSSFLYYSTIYNKGHNILNISRRLRDIRSLKALAAAVCKKTQADMTRAPDDVKELLSLDYL